MGNDGSVWEYWWCVDEGWKGMWIRALLAGLLIAVTLLSVSVLVFRAGLFATPVYQVHPAALDEARSVGMVQAEGRLQVDYDGEPEIINKLVIDVGGVSFRERADRVTSFFLDRGWEIVARNQVGVAMKSGKWNAFLTVDSFDSHALQHYPDVLEAVKSKAVKTEELVVVTVDYYHGYIG